MHTAIQLDQAMFDVRISGAPSTRAALFPDWGPHDRLGVVVTRPLGAIGASYLIQLAITAFYDVRPERRTTNGHYPDIYLLHVGRAFGDHLAFDFWPPRKEVVTGPTAEDVLDAIHDRAITRLAVPDGTRRPVEHRLKEPAAARDRVASSFVYSPTGLVDDADVTIAASDPRTAENTEHVLDPNRFVQMIDNAEKMVASTPEGESPLIDPRQMALGLETKQRVFDRWHEVSDAARIRATEERRALMREGVLTESYRRISVEEALERLVP